MTAGSPGRKISEESTCERRLGLRPRRTGHRHSIIDEGKPILDASRSRLAASFRLGRPPVRSAA
jgi:hypothetical protein